MPRVALRGSARLACARPAFVGRSLRHAPCIPRAVARLTPRSFRHRRRWTFTLLSIGQHSPAHAPSREEAGSCIHPTHRQGIAPSLLGLLAALASNPLGCLKASGGRRIARTGPSLVVPPATGPRCAPQSRGEEMHHSAPKNDRALIHCSALRSTKYICLLNAQAEPTAQA